MLLSMSSLPSSLLLRRIVVSLSSLISVIWLAKSGFNTLGAVNLWFSNKLAVSTTQAFNSICTEKRSNNDHKAVFIDDFNDDHLNSLYWTFTDGPHHGQYREALGVRSNVYIEDGALVLRSLRNKTEYDGKIYQFTSGAVTTRDKVTWKSGIACVVAKLPGQNENSDGIWPAHWMMPNKKSCWPDHGEIDIMEMVNGDGEYHATYHWNRFFPENSCQRSRGNTLIGDSVKVANWYNEWHEYAVKWDGSSYLTFYVDGKIVANVTSSSTDDKHNSHAQFSGENFYLILNTALGWSENWNVTRPVNNDTIFPVYHRIDKVTVLQSE